MMNCQQATRLLSDAQESELSLKNRATLKFHVMMCSGCRNFAEQMGTLREIAREYVKGSDAQGSSNPANFSDGERE
ncbi:MAG TPA: zf-HC2 domain-containing protein [Thiolinea sp.]|nr:zf-HC2 domain-containing protein [Thiolinea sp.]